MNNRKNNKRTLLLGVFLVSPLIILIFIAFNVNRDGYIDGKTPIKDATKYFIYVKDDVFKKNSSIITQDASSWIRIEDSNKNNIQLCATDSVKFKSLLLGSDSLALKTIEQYPNHGFKWGIDEDLGYYFSLPRETGWDKSNYIKVPTWLMAILIDEKVLDMKKQLKQ